MRLLITLVATSISATAAGAVPEIPVATFFGPNYASSAHLSPDGTQVAFLAPRGETNCIAVLNLDTGKPCIPYYATDNSMYSVEWKGDGHLIYTGIIDGLEWSPMVGVTDLTGKVRLKLLSAAEDDEFRSGSRGYLFDLLPRDPDNVLLWVRGYLSKTNINDGREVYYNHLRVSDPTASYDSFVTDHQGLLRVAKRYKDYGASIVYKAVESDPWSKLHDSAADFDPWQVLAFTPDEKGLYVIDREVSDHGVLRILDLATLKAGPVLFDPEQGEIRRLVFSRDTKRLIGVVYADEKVHCHWFEGKYQEIQRRMDASFPGYSVTLESTSEDEQRILVATFSDRDPGAYYVLNLQKGKLVLVTPVAPKINPHLMARMQPVTFTARDGLAIHGYLTLPADAVPGKSVPLVVHPHGGPFDYRDYWGFDPEVQFLANRGYAVIQVNYRGSGGYGTAFLKAGFREWGGKMQDDLTDAVRWAVAQGYADPKRVAIYGSSYGGYATLAGLTFTPELYKCGANYVGPSDLPELLRSKYGAPSDGEVAYTKLRFGDDSKVLAARSPVNFVERIRVPLLNAYGENDKRVEIYQWKELKAQLDKYHKEYDYIVAKDEGHGFYHARDAIEFYTRLDAFLKKNL